MYQGSNPVAIRSQFMLLDSFNELLEEKGYQEISIREICERSTISRQTFYKLFGSKENLLLFRLEHSPYANQDTVSDEADLSLEEICSRISIYMTANYRQFRMLLENDLMEVLYTQIYQSMGSCRHSFINMETHEKEYAVQFIAAGVCRLVGSYIRDHDEIDTDELKQLMYKIMSGSIFRRK